MTQTQTHTPTPWKAVKNPQTAATFNIFGSFNEAGDGIRLAEVMSGPAEMTEPYCGTPQYKGTQGEANAAFIVRACNSHEKLVEALRDTANTLYAMRDYEIANGKEGKLEQMAIDRIIAALERE